jgi:hypothetical protein
MEDRFLTHTEFAKKLDGREYGSEISREEHKEAHENGLVVVYGASDDLIEFNGCIDEELGCWLGADFGIKIKDMSVKEDYQGSKNRIKAIWNDEELGTSWSYKTNIPHSTFNIYEDDDLYCIGIIFSIHDLC